MEGHCDQDGEEHCNRAARDSCQPCLHRHSSFLLHESHNSFLQYVVSEKTDGLRRVCEIVLPQCSAGHGEQTFCIADFRLHGLRRNIVADHFASSTDALLHSVDQRMPGYGQRRQPAEQIAQVIVTANVREFMENAQPEPHFRVIVEIFRQQKNRMHNANNHRAAHIGRLAQLRQPGAQATAGVLKDRIPLRRQNGEISVHH